MGYWHLKAVNGEKIAQGEGYASKQHCLDAIKLVKSSKDARKQSDSAREFVAPEESKSSAGGKGHSFSPHLFEMPSQLRCARFAALIFRSTGSRRVRGVSTKDLYLNGIACANSGWRRLMLRSPSYAPPPCAAEPSTRRCPCVVFFFSGSGFSAINSDVPQF